MKIVNTKVVKGIKVGDFRSRKCLEILNNKNLGWDVEIKCFGLHLRWYPGRKFIFIRTLA